MKKILLVEDNDTIVMGLKYLLEKENFEVKTVKNLEETYKIAEKEKFNLYLLDINLPDGNGFDICSKLKEKEDVPIIFLTARQRKLQLLLYTFFPAV